MVTELTLAIPGRPGESEAWRRFLQERQGSRQGEFTARCQSRGLIIEEVWLPDTLGGAVVMVVMDTPEKKLSLK
jgi:hypothetical protein